MEQKNKVVKFHENGNPIENKEIDDRGERDELSGMDKLPPEILTKILDYLNEQQLVKCRLLSSRWNEICCLLLQEKTKTNPKSNLVVRFQKVRRGNSLECKTVITKPLDDFLDCFFPSEAEKTSSSSHRPRPFPFSCFQVTGLNYMNKSQLTKLVFSFRHIKSIFIDIKVQDMETIGLFWRLLLKFAPNIQHLGISGVEHLNRLDLFEPYFNFNIDSNPEDEPQKQKNSFLKNLKIFEIMSERLDNIDSFIRYFLKHGPNVQELIFKKRRDSNTFESEVVTNSFYLLQLWTHLERVHLLKKLETTSTSKSGRSPSDLMKNLQLEELHADCDVSFDSVEAENEHIPHIFSAMGYFMEDLGAESDLSSNSKANQRTKSNYIYHAMKSSRETLTKLNLQNLTMESMNRCFKDISSLPNVRQLDIQIQRAVEAGNIVQRLSQLCPKITSLDAGNFVKDFPQVAPILWTGFTGLKSLVVNINMTDKKNNFLVLDSAISGYSQDSIQKIQTKLEEGISLEEARRGEKQNPSILDLKELSRLQLQFFMGKRTNETEQVVSQLRNSVFMKILPQHIREHPRLVALRYM